MIILENNNESLKGMDWHFIIRPPPKYCYVALSRPTVKCEKNRVGFFFILFFMSDLGEEFAKICIQWLKKALVYAF